MHRHAALAAISLALAAAPAALSAQSPGDVAAFHRGECVMRVNGSPRECHTLVYMHFTRTGRTSFSIGSGPGMATFSGTEYRVDGPGRRSLQVDRFYESVPGEDSEPREASGVCRLEEGAEGVVRRLVCDADGVIGAVHVEFRGDGSPPQVVNQPLG
jgi:hypothetical protein